MMFGKNQYSYYVTGSNLFKQWYGCDENVIDEFTGLREKQTSNCEFDVSHAELIHIGWAHNIFQYDQGFYITGDYKGLGQYLEKLNLPEECLNCPNLTIISNDCQLIIVNKVTCKIWSLDLDTKEVKQFKLCTEVPLSTQEKKLKREDQKIVKCVAANDVILFLTNEGLVYTGLPPTLVDTSKCVGKPIDIQCGYEHCVLLTDSGRVCTWGIGRRLQLGHGDTSCYDTPTQVEALAGVKMIKIASGGWHTLALSEFGDVYAWGWNDIGQLGFRDDVNNELASGIVPICVDICNGDDSQNLENVNDIACGSNHSAILLADNSVWTSGNNNYGQLGFSKDSNPTVDHFKLAGSFNAASRIMCGQWSTAVLCKAKE